MGNKGKQEIIINGEKAEFVYFYEDLTVILLEDKIFEISTDKINGEPLTHQEFIDIYSPNEYQSYLN